jgi:hypothetical protein
MSSDQEYAGTEREPLLASAQASARIVSGSIEARPRGLDFPHLDGELPARELPESTDHIQLFKSLLNDAIPGQ